MDRVQKAISAYRKKDLSLQENRHNCSLLTQIPDADRLFHKGYHRNILGGITGLRQSPISNPKRDELYIKKFIESNPAGIIDRDYLHAHSTLLEIIMNDMKENPAGWQYPRYHYLESLQSNASIDEYSGVSTKTKELLMSHTTSTKEIRDFSLWTAFSMEEDWDRFPINFTSFSVVYITIEAAQFTNLRKQVQKLRAGETKSFDIPVPDLGSKTDTELVKFPAKFVFGDGVKWMGCISFDIQKVLINGNRSFRFNFGSLNKDFVKLMEGLPTLVGIEAIKYKNNIEETLLEFYGLRIKLPMCLELETLAVSAGWNLPITDMVTLNLIATGTMFPVDNLAGDNSFNVPFSCLPQEFQVYLISTVKVGHMLSITFMTLLHRNTFPDPDALCSALGLNQWNSIKWFGWLATKCLCEKLPLKKYFSNCSQKSDFIETIRDVIISKENGITLDLSCMPSEVYLFSHLHRYDIPSITWAGPRCLQHVRANFVGQLQTLYEICKEHPQCRHPTLAINLLQPLPEVIKHLTFNRGQEIEFPTSGENSSGLLCHPYLEPMDLNNPSDRSQLLITTDHIHHQAEQKGIDPVLGIIEWARLHPQQIQPLLNHLDSINLYSPDYAFWIGKSWLYERLRLMYITLYDGTPTVVQQLTELYTAKTTAIKDCEYAAVSRVDKQIKFLSGVKADRIARINFIEAEKLKRQESHTIETGVQQRAYKAVPGKFTERNRKLKCKKKMKTQRAINRKLAREDNVNKNDLRHKLNSYEDNQRKFAVSNERYNKIQKLSPNKIISPTVPNEGYRVDCKTPDVPNEGNRVDHDDNVCHNSNSRRVRSLYFTPTRYRSPTPRYRSPTPRYRSPSPNYRSPTPPRFRSPFSTRFRSPTPNRSRSPIPTTIRSPTPNWSRYPTPTRFRSPTSDQSSPTSIVVLVASSPSPTHSYNRTYSGLHERSPVVTREMN